MRKNWLSLLACWAFFCSSVAAAPIPLPAAPKLAASSWILVDYNSGDVLAEHEPDKQIEPASITKIMTSYVVYQALNEGLINLTDQVPISEKAWRMKGSRMFVEVGKQVLLEDLLRGLAIQSGNDAAVALSEYVAGTEDAFVDQMNATAAQLGMNNTQFQNVTGWPAPQHYTTARDVATLSAALIRDFPERYKVYSEKEFTYNNIRQSNRNKLLWRDSSVDGIKTGHTEAAGYCLAASAKRDDMRLISVVMGTQSESARAKYSQTLLNYGFRYYESHRLYAAGETLQEVKVWKGDQKTVALGPLEDVFVTIPRGQYKNLKPSLEGVPSPLEAPLQKTKELGRITVMLNDKVVADVPAVALSQVEEGTFFSTLTDTILLLFE